MRRGIEDVLVMTQDLGTKDQFQQKDPNALASDQVDAPNNCEQPKNSFRPDRESVKAS